MTIQTFEKFQVKMLQIGFCLYRADENAKRLVNIDSHFEQLLIAIMYTSVSASQSLIELISIAIMILTLPSSNF